PLATLQGGKPVCVYDYSAAEGLPNCCIGKYTITVDAWDTSLNAGAGGYKTTTTSNHDWGGKASSCLSGAATVTQPKTKDGYPMSIITYVEGTGLNETYKAPSPHSQERGGNIFVANYFDPADHTTYGNPAGFETPVTSPPSGSPYPYYEWGCLDHAYEYK